MILHNIECIECFYMPNPTIYRKRYDIDYRDEDKKKYYKGGNGTKKRRGGKQDQKRRGGKTKRRMIRW